MAMLALPPSAKLLERLGHQVADALAAPRDPVGGGRGDRAVASEVADGPDGFGGHLRPAADPLAALVVKSYGDAEERLGPTAEQVRDQIRPGHQGDAAPRRGRLARPWNTPWNCYTDHVDHGRYHIRVRPDRTGRRVRTRGDARSVLLRERAA